MGLFGKKKDYTALALEEARRREAGNAAARFVPGTPEAASGPAVTKFSFNKTITAQEGMESALAELVAKVSENAPAPVTAVIPGETVRITTVHSLDVNDPRLNDALAALGFGPGASPQVPGLGAQQSDGGFSAALDGIERDYVGKPVAQVKVVVEAAFKAHGHSVPDMVVDMIAKNVSEGTDVDVTFGG